MISDKSDKTETAGLSKQYLNISYYTLLTSIPEMLSEWWSYSGKDVKNFIKDEDLSEIIDEKTFADILIGRYKFTNQFLSLMRAKIPYDITLDKLYFLNKTFEKEHPEAETLCVDSDKLHLLLRKIYLQKKEKRKNQILNWQKEHKESRAKIRALYLEKHKEEIQKRRKEYRETHREQIKAYKESHREISNLRQRERYHADIEKSREKGRLHQKQYREQNKEKIHERDRKYRAEHKEEIKQNRQSRLENEEYRTHVREIKRANYHKNAARIQQKRKQQRLEKIEEALIKERQYGAVYRNKHRDEINARGRQKYQENLTENRKKSVIRTKKYRNKLRFKNTTGKIIMPLLSALAIHKANSESRK